MYHLPLTLDTAAANLALDEALLDAAVAGDLPGELLRVWEPAEFFVVLGRSSRAEQEVRLDACRADGVPVLRRPSGGAAVLAGPGCLMYAVVLDAERRIGPRAVDRAHELVLDRHVAALRVFHPTVARAGTSDLVIADPSNPDAALKFSGNSLRLKRQHLLYHGTILYDFPLERIARWLGQPARRPEYRGTRDHASFVTNLDAQREAIVQALVETWNAPEPLKQWPRKRTADLAAERYATLDW